MPETSPFIKPLYFLSDVHLGVADPETERAKLQRLLHLIEDARHNAAALYIVGDLFDFWYEYRSVVPRGYHRLYAALEELRAAGVEVTYLAGNHDFAINGFFSDDLGLQIVRDDLDFEYGGKRFYLFHGDGLAVRDGGYRLLKRVLRSPYSQWAFRLLHPDLGFGIARKFSHSSRDYTSGKTYGETDGMRIEASRRIDEGVDYVIMGHRHLPMQEQIKDGFYINLGDWIRHFTYAVFDHQGLTLYTIKHGIQELFPL